MSSFKSQNDSSKSQNNNTCKGQNDSFWCHIKESQIDSLKSRDIRGVKLTLYKGSFWGHINDSFKGVISTLLFLQCIVCEVL